MPSRLRDAGVALTVLIGIALAVSDYVWAGVYRTEGGRLYRELRQGSSATIWQVGHWGWQWYAKQNGMQQYDTTTSNLKPGDFVVVAEYVHKQNLTPEHNQQLHFISIKTIPSADVVSLAQQRTDRGIRRLFLPAAFSAVAFLKHTAGSVYCLSGS